MLKKIQFTIGDVIDEVKREGPLEWDFQDFYCQFRVTLSIQE